MLAEKMISRETILSTFSISDMEFGIDVTLVREAILYKGAVLKMPTELDIFEGVINLRGNIIPILNMRKRFGVSGEYASDSKCIAIVNYKAHYIGLMFDDISQVVRVDSSEIANFANAPKDENFANEGVILLEKGNALIQILDLETVFKDCDLHLLENTSMENKKKFLEIKQDITFFIDGQEYALGMDDIQEIVNFKEIKNKVKHCEFVCGVITLRDKIIPIVCLKKYFGSTSAQIEKDSKIIILRCNPVVGIIVDAIKEVIHYEVDKLLPVNHLAESKSKNIFSNIIALSEDRNIIKISLDKLFTEEAKKQIEAGIYLNKDEDKISNENSTFAGVSQDNRILDKEFILFKLGDVFAIQIEEFQEIIKYPDTIAALPGSENYLEGVLNLRSEPIMIINLRKYYNLEDYANKDDLRILILNINKQKIGIMVDEVLEILKTDKTEVTKSPQIAQRKTAESYCKHIKEIMCVKSKEKDSRCSSLIMEFNTASFISSMNLGDIELGIEYNESENSDSIENDVLENMITEEVVIDEADSLENETVDDFFNVDDSALTEEKMNFDSGVVDKYSEDFNNERSEDEVEQE